jgi:acetyl-CoA carboxylase carboxyltransferase component
MYADHGGCPSGGVVVKWDTSKGNNVLSLNDATVKAGAWLITAKKNLRTRNRHGKSPHLFSDSAGVYLPLQDEIFPDKEHFGRIFRNNAQMVIWCKFQQ